jgi:hypothetical protein
MLSYRDVLRISHAVCVAYGKTSRWSDVPFVFEMEIGGMENATQAAFLKWVNTLPGNEAVTLRELKDWPVGCKGLSSGSAFAGDYNDPPEVNDNRELDEVEDLEDDARHKHSIPADIFKLMKKDDGVSEAMQDVEMTHEEQMDWGDRDDYEPGDRYGSIRKAFRPDSPIADLPFGTAALVMKATGQEEQLAIALKKFMAKVNEVYAFYVEFLRDTGLGNVATLNDIQGLRAFLENRTGFFKRMNVPPEQIQEAYAEAIMKRAPAMAAVTAAGPTKVEDLNDQEQAVAKKMQAKGYNYIVQVTTVDGDFGAPLYFKGANDVGPFLRSFPDYKNAKTAWGFAL